MSEIKANNPRSAKLKGEDRKDREEGDVGNHEHFLPASDSGEAIFRGDEMPISIIKAVALTFTVGAFAMPQVSAADDIEKFVLQKAFDAGMSGDTETAMSMLTDDVFFAALPAPGHPMWSAGYLSGKEAVSAWWAFVGSDEGYLRIVDLKVDGNRAMYQGELSINSLKALGVAPAMIDGVALLRDGKIYGLMTTFTPEARKAIAEAQN